MTKGKDPPKVTEKPKIKLKLTKRPKKTSNNIKLDDLRGEQENYFVPTVMELMKA